LFVSQNLAPEEWDFLAQEFLSIEMYREKERRASLKKKKKASKKKKKRASPTPHLNLSSKNHLPTLGLSSRTHSLKNPRSMKEKKRRGLSPQQNTKGRKELY